VEEELKSGQPNRMAWGAYRAQKEHLQNFVPKLSALIENPIQHKDAARMYLSVIDALIQLRAQPEVGKIETLCKRHLVLLDSAVVLLLQSGASGHELLSILPLAERDSNAWLAAANRIVALKTPGFAAYLMNGFQARLHVGVSSPDPHKGKGLTAHIGRGLGTRGWGDGVIKAPADFPPLVTYNLLSADLEVDHPVLISPGLVPIVYERVEHPNREAGTGGRSMDDTDRRKYLKALAGENDEFINRDSDRRINLAWKDERSFLESIAQERMRIETSFRNFVERMKTGGVLTNAEASAVKLNLKIEVDDLRPKKEPPLPSIPK
jgi:hypothetical protein